MKFSGLNKTSPPRNTARPNSTGPIARNADHSAYFFNRAQPPTHPNMSTQTSDSVQVNQRKDANTTEIATNLSQNARNSLNPFFSHGSPVSPGQTVGAISYGSGDSSNKTPVSSYQQNRTYSKFPQLLSHNNYPATAYNFSDCSRVTPQDVSQLSQGGSYEGYGIVPSNTSSKESSPIQYRNHNERYNRQSSCDLPVQSLAFKSSVKTYQGSKVLPDPFNELDAEAQKVSEVVDERLISGYQFHSI